MPTAEVPLQQLEKLEADVVLLTVGHYIDLGLALLKIKETKLYEARGAKSFDSYLEENAQWIGVKPRQARHTVAAANFARLLPKDSFVPACERHARPLLKKGIPIQKALELWDSLCKFQDHRTITSDVVKNWVHRHTQGTIIQEGTSDDDDEPKSLHGGGGHGTITLFTSSNSDLWYTPLKVIKCVHRFFSDGITLDPCSDNIANLTVRAKHFYTKQQDGLKRRNAWWGDIYINPPYGLIKGQSTAGLFFGRAILEFKAKATNQAIILLKAAVGYNWFKKVYDYPHCWFESKLCFRRGTGVASTTQNSANMSPHGYVIVYLGANVERFCKCFSQLGAIPGFNSWSFTGQHNSGT